MAKKQAASKQKRTPAKGKSTRKPVVKPKERFNPKLPDPLTTATAKNIIPEFIAWVNIHSAVFSDYGRWYCGITNSPPTRKAQHQSSIQSEPYAWFHRNAGSRRIAEAIETYFHEEGMLDHDSKGGSAENSKYVYIFKKKPTIFD